MIIARPIPKFDGRQQVVGRVLEGMDIVSRIESCGSSDGTPLQEVIITDCGEGETAASKKRKQISDVTPFYEMPEGWIRKESRSEPGVFYYANEKLGKTQFHMPSIPFGVHAVGSGNTKKARLDGNTSPEPKFDRCKEDQVRVMHIMKMHKDFYGNKPSSLRIFESTSKKKLEPVMNISNFENFKI